MMNKPASMSDVFDLFLEHSGDPFLNSMQGLPANILDQLMVDLVKSADIKNADDKLTIVADLRAFKNRVKGAFRSQIFEDEVGVLIQYGASKNVISEVTGVHQSKVVLKRKTMEANYPGQGRPKQLDEWQRPFIVDIWNRFTCSKTVKLIRTHHYSGIPINDVWLVVRDIKSPLLDEAHEHVSKQNRNNAS